jgi:hypothetical protein
MNNLAQLKKTNKRQETQRRLNPIQSNKNSKT